MKKTFLWMLAAVLTLCGSVTALTACSSDDSDDNDTSATEPGNGTLNQQLTGTWYAFYEASGTTTAQNPDTKATVTVDYSHVLEVYDFDDNGEGFVRRLFFGDKEFKPLGMQGLATFKYTSTVERPLVEGQDLGSGRVSVTFSDGTWRDSFTASGTLTYDDDNLTATGIGGKQVVMLPANEDLSKVIDGWSGISDGNAAAAAAAAGAGIISLEGIATLDWHGLFYLLEPNKQAAIIGVTDYSITDITVDSYRNMSYISTAQVYHISRIGPGALRGLKHLRSINMADSGIQEIGAEAFKGCKSLVTATIPASCTVLGKEAYMDCTNLKTANMPGVNEMGEGCFENCPSMTTVSLSREGLVTIPRRAFYGCRGLNTLEIPDCVVDIEAEAFRNCAGFNPLILPKKLASVGDYAFEGCTSLITLTCHNENMKFGKYAFANCTSLLTVTPGTFYSKIDETVFSGCVKLKAKPAGQ